MSVLDCGKVVQLLVGDDVTPELFGEIHRLIQQYEMDVEGLAQALKSFVPFEIVEVSAIACLTTVLPTLRAQTLQHDTLWHMQDVKKAIDSERKRAEFAEDVDQVAEGLNRVMVKAGLLQIREYDACLKPSLQGLLPSVLQLSKAARDQSTLEEAAVGKEVDDMRNREFHRVLAKMEGVEKGVQYKKAYRTSKLALLMWMCDREIALRASEDEVEERMAE